ncbi:MAG: MFS transporter [Sandaracinaceae bacterium]
MPSSSRSLGLYLAGRLADTVGIQVQSVAIGWQVYDLTRDPLDLGWVGMAQFLPVLLLSLPGGQLADRFDRRVIVVTTQVGYAVGALTLALAAGRGTPTIFSVLVLLGTLRAFKSPASSALVPWIVKGDALPRAIALSSTTYQVGTVLGPALGGAIYAAGGPTTAYYAAGACQLVAAGLTSAVRAERPPRVPSTESRWRRVLEGLRFVWDAKVLFGAISLDLFAVLLGGAVALLPVFARDILHVGELGLGALRAAPAAGAALVALVLAVRPIERRAGAWMLACVAIFGAATIVFGASEDFALSLAALAVLGGADMVSVVIRQSIIQLWTPDEMRGRVAAVSFLFIGASNELGEWESGVTAKHLGTVRAVVLGGVGTLVVTGAWAAIFGSLRRVDALSEPDR